MSTPLSSFIFCAADIDAEHARREKGKGGIW